MEFRPCIDIHNGKVKQIVGSSLRDAGDQASENFVSGQDAPFYARMYQSRGIRGGHIILLNAKDSPYYEKPKIRRWRLCVPIRGDCRSAEELPMPMHPNFWKLAHLQ